MLRSFLENRTHRIFILIFLFGLSLRIFSINNPLLDQHAWRQSSCGIVARNYLTNMNLLRPQVDMVATSYPPAFSFYEYYVALLAKIFGFSVALGRSLTLFVSLIGFVYLFRLARRYFGDSCALWSSAFYAFLPTAAYYARSFQADGGMVALTIVFIYYFARWVEEGATKDYVKSIIAAAFMISFKLPSLYMFIAATLYLFMFRKWRLLLDWKYYGFILFSATVPLLYYYLVPIVSADIYSGSIAKSYKLTELKYLFPWKFWFKAFFPWGNLWEYHFAHTGYILFVLGIFKRVQDRRQWLFYLWMGAVFMFFIVAAFGMHHEYYSLPLVPVAAIFMGRFVSDFFATHRWVNGQRFVYGLVCFMILYAFVFSLCRIWTHSSIASNAHYIPMAKVIQEQTQPDDLVLYTTKGFEELQFLAHRKGFHVSRDKQKQLYTPVADIPDLQYSVFALADYQLKENDPELYAALCRSCQVLYEHPKAYVFKLHPERSSSKGKIGDILMRKTE